jgi:hypothetical protein
LNNTILIYLWKYWRSFFSFNGEFNINKEVLDSGAMLNLLFAGCENDLSWLLGVKKLEETPSDFQ